MTEATKVVAQKAQKKKSEASQLTVQGSNPVEASKIFSGFSLQLLYNCEDHFHY